MWGWTILSRVSLEKWEQWIFKVDEIPLAKVEGRATRAECHVRRHMLKYLSGQTGNKCHLKWKRQLMLDLGVRWLKRSSIYFSTAEYVIFIFWTFRVKILIFFSPCRVTCGILVPWPGIKYSSLAVKAWSLNHWTAREFPRIKILDRWEKLI